MNTLNYNLYPNGECGFTIVFDEPVSKALSIYIIGFANHCQYLLGAEQVAIIPAYQSVAFYCIDQDKAEIQRQVELLLKAPLPAQCTSSRLIRIPVCYDISLGPDLLSLSQCLHLSIDDIIDKHSQQTYLVHMLGFLPGFLYLGGLDKQLACPRKSTPALSVPAGSVGIGGNQTGIYPVQSPGGWHIIGRTPQSLFTPESKTPFIANPLDEVRFDPISLDVYKQQKAEMV